MANFFYASDVSFLISNSASFAELVEAEWRHWQINI